MIGRLVARSVRANVLRFLLTTFAVFVGVAFVTTAFGLADQLRGIIDTSEIPTASAGGASQLQVAPKSSGFGPPAALNVDLADKIAEVDGVASATPSYFMFVEFDSGTERAEGFQGLQGVAAAGGYNSDDWELIDGRAPAGPKEVAVDADGKLAALANVGGQVDILLPTGRERFNVVGEVAAKDAPSGIFSFIKANAVFDEDTLGKISGNPTSASAILVSLDPAADPAATQKAIKATIPAGLEVLSADQVTAQIKDQLTTIADWIERVMLIFAGVTLFVGTFLVVNTFTMVVGQRIRELGLLRAVGGNRQQLFTMVAAEALLVGAVASLVGLGVGLALATVVGNLIKSEGAFQIIVTPRTVGMALLIGMGVTLISAIAPAMKAARIQPLAAINGIDARQDDQRKWPTIVAALTVVGGAILLAAGFGDDLSFGLRMGYLLPGALMLFVGLAILSRFVARPVMAVLGQPVKFRISARMGAANAARNPRRTATTASALMIGLALIVTVVTVGTSVKDAILNQFKTASNADYYLQPEGFGQIDPASIANDVAAVSTVAESADFSFAIASLKGPKEYRITQMTSAPLDRFPTVFDLGVEDGSVSQLDAGSVLIAADAAEDMGVKVGDTVELSNASGEATKLVVAATYAKTALAGQAVIDRAASDDLNLNPQFQGIAVTGETGASLTELRASLEKVGENYPSNTVKTRTEVEDEFGAQFDVILRIISALLIASVLIAGLGVMNTLILSVVERTREIGLLRAVGGTRRHVRSMIRWEALLTSTFGAILGVIVGTGLGFGIVSALPKSFVSGVTTPISWIIACLIFAIILGLLASIWPAFRASRMDILKAISTDR